MVGSTPMHSRFVSEPQRHKEHKAVLFLCVSVRQTKFCKFSRLFQPHPPKLWGGAGVGLKITSVANNHPSSREKTLSEMRARLASAIDQAIAIVHALGPGIPNQRGEFARILSF